MAVLFPPESPHQFGAMAGVGHGPALLSTGASTRCQCSQRTFAATLGNGRDAPIADLPGAVRPKPRCLLRLIEMALSVSAGGSSKQEKRWREAGRDRQVEAVSKRRKADQFRRTCRAAVLRQSRLRPRRWPRPVVLGLLGKRCCAPDRSGPRRRALRPQVRQGVPVPGRLATPSARGENACESWPRPS
jgi:hypothetical protein